MHSLLVEKETLIIFRSWGWKISKLTQGLHHNKAISIRLPSYKDGEVLIEERSEFEWDHRRYWKIQKWLYELIFVIHVYIIELPFKTNLNGALRVVVNSGTWGAFVPLDWWLDASKHARRITSSKLWLSFLIISCMDLVNSCIKTVPKNLCLLDT